MSTKKGINVIRENEDWKQLPISIGPKVPNKFELILFEELNDYSLENDRFGDSLKDEVGKPKENKVNDNKKKKKRKRKKKGQQQKNSEEESNQMKKRKVSFEENVALKIDESQIISEMSSWNQFSLPVPILQALLDQGFKTPMKIQEEVLPAAIQQRKDIFGAAETGSGKTLAFGIPLICHLMEDKARGYISYDRQEPKEEFDFTKELAEDFTDNDEDQLDQCSYQLPALILTPTRELAIQVKTHLLHLSKYTDVSVIAIVGGMSIQKQQRLLSKRPDIVIATPGRLWELVNNGNDEHVSQLHKLRYLVIDEADRMLERGHFDDLKKLFEIINSCDSYKKRQSFLFSATLTTERDVSTRVKKLVGYRTETREEKLHQLAEQLVVGKGKPFVVDLTTKKMTAEKLDEARILCGKNEKDYYLYYFLKSNPGRTLIFVNSIDSIFRLKGVLEALNFTPLRLHGGSRNMAQSTRLENLEKFQKDPNAIMIASDVAARGLDIADVKYVIHYHLARTVEVFVHRSGRTARSGKDGLSLLFVSPEESMTYKKICKCCNKPEGFPLYPINSSVMREVKMRVEMARDLDVMAYRQKKIRMNNDSFRKMAREADMVLDDELLTTEDEHSTKEKQHLMKMKRQQLAKLLKKPIFPKGFSGSFITKTGSLQLPHYQFAHNN